MGQWSHLTLYWILILPLKSFRIFSVPNTVWLSILNWLSSSCWSGTSGYPYEPNCERALFSTIMLVPLLRLLGAWGWKESAGISDLPAVHLIHRQLAYDSDFELKACSTAFCLWQSLWEATEPASNSIYRAEVMGKSNSIPENGTALKHRLLNLRKIGKGQLMIVMLSGLYLPTCPRPFFRYILHCSWGSWMHMASQCHPLASSLQMNTTY